MRDQIISIFIKEVSHLAIKSGDILKEVSNDPTK